MRVTSFIFFFIISGILNKSLFSLIYLYVSGFQKYKKNLRSYSGRCVRRSAAAVAVAKGQSLRDPHKPSVDTPSEGLRRTTPGPSFPFYFFYYSLARSKSLYSFNLFMKSWPNENKEIREC